MPRFVPLAAGGLLIAMLLGALANPQGPAPRAVSAPPPRYDGSISVLTYNIRGLPWPVALGRRWALARIADRLAALREEGRAPTIVVLQEAFTETARTVGRRAGYRFVTDGPGADAPAPATAAVPAGRGHWWRGETEGKYVGSGLQILSDFPVIAVRRLVFPRDACAGFDCLANKGALLVTIQIPGAPAPIDIVTTHLNSRHASRSPDDRNLPAYRDQVAALSAFIRANHDPRHPLIVAGDFNVGKAAPRRTTLMAAIARDWHAGPVDNAYDAYLRMGGRLDEDAAFSRHRARDWQFYADGRDAGLVLVGLDVPFGGHAARTMLSDHVGYAARFRLVTRSAGAGPVRDRSAASTSGRADS